MNANWVNFSASVQTPADLMNGGVALGISCVLYWVTCYLVGTFMTAWFVGKWKKVNLQQSNSQNLGARNAGRVLGKSAFLITFFGDAIKGALIIVVGRAIGLEQWMLAISMLLVISGHIFPFWLCFRGGKGIATFIGAGIALGPSLFVWMVIGTFVMLPLLKNLTLSMLGGYIFYIASMVWMNQLLTYSPVILAIGLILWKHRSNIRQSLTSLR